MVDVAHVPYWGSPLWPPLPTVVTIHDLIPLLLPHYRGSPLVRMYTRLVAASARRASLIITDSLASRADIVRCLRIPDDRIQVIYLAAAPSCHPVDDPDSLAALRARYALPERYILYLGGFDRRKNLQSLLRSYASLLCMDADAPALVIAGRLPSVDTELFPNPRRMASRLGLEKRVIFIGWIPEAYKPALYSGALFFAFLSLYEGFGLMPLEAMTCGIPVLAARNSSLPEIVGEGGLLVDPSEPAEVARNMRTLLDDSTRQTLRENAIRQASRFGWQQTASQTLNAYAVAIAGSTP
jgi:glycosyltransferase involved in cell wall biosynthesis